VIYDHPGPPWFYLPWVLLLLLPWSLYLPVAAIRLRFWRLNVWRETPPGVDLPLLALLWLVLMVAFFSAAATKLPGYILPSLPGGSLLVTLLFLPLQPETTPLAAGQRITGWCNAVLLALMALAAVLTPRWIETDPSYPAFADAVRASGLPWLLAVPLFLAAIALVLLLLRSRSGLNWLWLPNAAGVAAALALVLPVLVPLVDRERQLPIRALARLAGEQALPNEPLLVVGYKRYSVVFYSGRPVLFVSSPKEASEALQASGFTPQSLLILASDHELLDFGLGPGDATPLAQRDAHRLVRLSWKRMNQLR
jgi:4-amino-4-deoxy-L-arabinose transferase-like glycosyltransferase